MSKSCFNILIIRIFNKTTLMYQTLTKVLKRFFSDAQIFKHGFNLSPMYRRSTARVSEISEDLHYVKVSIPINYKNKNYVGSVFGGSLFSATDPIFMIQLVNILGNDYVVWDKSASIKFKRPVREKVFSEFIFSKEEIEQIKQDVEAKGEIDIEKIIQIKNSQDTIFCEVSKVIYVASKSFYKDKRKNRKLKTA